MTAFTIYDFSESVKRAEGFTLLDVKRAVAAWGVNGDYAEWNGGFLLELNDERYAYLEGWCDTTGWGCQDGVVTTMFQSQPNLTDLPIEFYDDQLVEWDTVVADLNRLILGEIKDFDSE